MKQQNAKPEQALPHDLILEGRNKLTVTGVRRVIRCDAEGAAMLTSKGTLELTGAELSVTSLDLDKGEVKLTGRVDTLEYTAEHTPGGFLRRRGGAGSAAASVRRCRSLCGETAAGTGAARRPVHRPVESRPRRRQSTAERKKTCKKTEKELANTTAYVV